MKRKAMIFGASFSRESIILAFFWVPAAYSVILFLVSRKNNSSTQKEKSDIFFDPKVPNITLLGGYQNLKNHSVPFHLSSPFYPLNWGFSEKFLGFISWGFGIFYPRDFLVMGIFFRGMGYPTKKPPLLSRDWSFASWPIRTF